jgi:hypothetical protein
MNCNALKNTTVLINDLRVSTISSLELMSGHSLSTRKQCSLPSEPMITSSAGFSNGIFT